MASLTEKAQQEHRESSVVEIKAKEENSVSK